VLAPSQRITGADDYRSIVRRGRRVRGSHTLLYIRPVPGAPSRYGFIVARTVGGAVVRNQVRRRLKAICYELAREGQDGTEVVVRALPSAASAGFDSLEREVAAGLHRLRASS
jgi:ribonuclease P protein component